MRSLLVAALVGLAACAPRVPAAPGPERTAEVVQLGIPAEQAVERVKLAFLEEGLALASAAGGVLVSTPAMVGSTYPAEFVYRATVVGEGDSSRVVITGSMRAANQGMLTAAVAGVRHEDAARPITSKAPSYTAADGWHGWAKVARLAAALRPQQAGMMD